jgi:hypothetical protein
LDLFGDAWERETEFADPVDVHGEGYNMRDGVMQCGI